MTTPQTTPTMPITTAPATTASPTPETLRHLRNHLRSAASMPLWWSLSRRSMIAAARLLDGVEGEELATVLADLGDEFPVATVAALELTLEAIRSRPGAAVRTVDPRDPRLAGKVQL